MQQKRLGIDDAWVALGMIFDFLLLISDCLYLQDYGERPRIVYVAYDLLKKCRKIPSKHKDSIILHVCSLFFLYLRGVANTTLGLHNSFTELYGKTLVPRF